MTRLKNRMLQSLHGRAFLTDICVQADGRAKPVVIHCHGFKGFKDWGPYNLMADAYAEAGYVFVKFNFSHNGTTIEQPSDFADLEAFGNNNFSIELDDLGVVIDWICSADFPIAEQEMDRNQIYLSGHSRGGGIVILKAGEDPRVKKAASWAGVNEFGKYWKQDQMQKIKDDGVIYTENGRTKQQMPIYWQLYENYFANLKRLYIPDVVRRLAIPLLLIHGTSDDAVPYTAANEMKEWKPDATLVTIENGNHVFGAVHPWTENKLPGDMNTVVTETIRFFKQ